MTRIVVIGGGIGGLATAFRLAQAARSRGRAAAITVIEAGARWGGVCRSARVEGCLVEEGPDSIIRVKPAGMALIHDLGLDDEVIATEPGARRGLIAKGRRLLPVPEGFYLLAPAHPLPFLLSPLMSWRGKLRLVCELWRPRRPADAPEESLGAFVRRRFGEEALTRLAQPLVGGIYTADPDRLSLAATMPQFIAMEREHGSVIRALRARAAERRDEAASGPRYGLFVSLRDGLGRLGDALVERLRADGCELRAEVRARALRRAGSGWSVEFANGASVLADQVVLALPANAAATLTSGFDDRLGELLTGIPYAGVATISLAIAETQARVPAAAGFVVPAVEGRTTLACTFASRKYASRAPAGTTLLRAFVGGALHPDALARGDAELAAAVVADLRELIGLRGEPRWTHVSRWPAAMAQLHLGHLERVAAIRAREAAAPDLALVGNGYEGVGIPDLAAQAQAAAERLAAAW